MDTPLNCAPRHGVNAVEIPSKVAWAEKARLQATPAARRDDIC